MDSGFGNYHCVITVCSTCTIIKIVKHRPFFNDYCSCVKCKTETDFL